MKTSKIAPLFLTAVLACSVASVGCADVEGDDSASSDDALRAAAGVEFTRAVGAVLVNGKKVDRPSFSMSIGDVVTVREGVQKLCREQMESIPGHQVPGWLAVNPAELSAKCVANPTSDQIPFDVNPNLIVEFYR